MHNDNPLIYFRESKQMKPFYFILFILMILMKQVLYCFAHINHILLNLMRCNETISKHIQTSSTTSKSLN